MSPPTIENGSRHRQLFWPLLLAVSAALLIIAFIGVDWLTGLPADAKAEYVGRQTCAQCHQAETQRHAGSFHDLAMDPATDKTVLGNFENAELAHHGTVSRMFRRDGKFWINTEGPDGSPADFEIKYVFGVDPLQQYMVEFDRPANMPDNEISRVQVLRVSWDTANKRWFHLDPPDVKEKLAPDDILHWTGMAQCWNNMCADCHSTNLKKGFDVRQGRYHTTFSEMDVSCESCHGPGSLHVTLARSTSLFWDRDRGYAIESLRGESPATEVETCAQCHSRRRIIAGDFRPGEPYHDFFGNESLHRMAYHADGQNLDEVYEFGSFTQSRMYHKNIRCSDCHDPHSTKLKFEGNRVCTSCHAHPAGRYDTVAHHHHAPGTPGASCVECHMPAGLYMDVDLRRDHGLRVPRPDLSVPYQTPNACSQCHIADDKTLASPTKQKFKHYGDWLVARKDGDQDVAAALAKIDAFCAAGWERWYPDRKPRKEDLIVPGFTAAREGKTSSPAALAKIARNRELPEIVRATAVMEAGAFMRPGSPAITLSLDALDDPGPQVRAAAVANLESLPRDEIRSRLVPLLKDRSRLVRIEAARVMSVIFRPEGEQESSSGLRGHEHEDFRNALDEYFASLEQLSDRAAAHLAKGTIHENMNQLDEAELCYRTALRLEPNIVTPRSNLAALLERRVEEARRQGAEFAKAGNREMAVKIMEPVSGQQVMIEKLRGEELLLYERDATLAPKNASVQYRYGLNLYLAGQPDAAAKVLQQAVDLEPANSEYLVTLSLLLEKMGQIREAVEFARRAQELWPDDAAIREIVARLQGAR